MPDLTYASFMVRLWRDPDRDSDDDELVWMVEVESVQTGRTWQLQDVESLTALLTLQLNENTMITQGGGLDVPISPNAPADR
ncbi:MAG: hypothetical protein GY764_15795 [Halieaceae bacterium]|nr:hypothetical protein [Halieaceae bacterium]